MPSGAKKRKAAKKKKEQETIPNNPQPQGNNELKSRGEKGSDDGSPPAHERDTAAAAAVSNPLKEVPNHSKINEGVVMIEEDLKSEECYEENKNVSSVHIESAKESDYGNGNSCGSIDKTVTAKNSKDEPHNSVKEMASFGEEVNSVKETVNLVAESSADTVEVVKSVSEMQNGDTENVLPEKSIGSQVGESDLDMKRNDDKVHPFPDEDVRTSSLEEPEAKELDSKVSPSSEAKEFDSKVSSSSDAKEFDSKVSSSSEAKEYDGKVSSSESHSAIPRSSSYGAEHVKDSDSTECSENQPLVASAPPMVQKTSWLSCCGLFEVLSGSNR